MSQFPDQVISLPDQAFFSNPNQGINMVNPAQFGQIPHPPVQNKGVGLEALDQKKTESNSFLIIYIFWIIFIERHRRSKHEPEGRDYICPCGKSFLSQPALNNHKKKKHSELMKGQEKRGRGRPRKNPLKTTGDFETLKYDSFFNTSPRKAEEGQNVDMKKVVNEVFNFIYKGKHFDKLFSHPESYEENPILKNLYEKAQISQEDKSKITCDDAFYEYLCSFKDKTNEKYFKLLLKFVLLFRECYDKSKNKDVKEEDKKPVTNSLSPEGLPDLCNEFYGEFLEPNDFFDLNENEEKNEIIEIIQHFCIWLFKKDYTKSKLSLANWNGCKIWFYLIL